MARRCDTQDIFISRPSASRDDGYYGGGRRSTWTEHDDRRSRSPRGWGGKGSGKDWEEKMFEKFVDWMKGGKGGKGKGKSDSWKSDSWKGDSWKGGKAGGKSSEKGGKNGKKGYSGSKGGGKGKKGKGKPADAGDLDKVLDDYMGRAGSESLDKELDSYMGRASEPAAKAAEAPAAAEKADDKAEDKEAKS
mmetsp:Transcript_69303/g.129439  ORF Transcript_69303/g.129439 Transcript_69303/m.129439 type:complete len:191 (+) Transcript_69303:60-632(+)